MKLLDRTDFNTTALEGIMVVREEDGDKDSPTMEGSQWWSSLCNLYYTANIPVQSMGAEMDMET